MTGTLNILEHIENYNAGKYAYLVGCYKKQHLYISLTDTETNTLLDKQIIEYGWSDAKKTQYRSQNAPCEKSIRVVGEGGVTKKGGKL